jgi:hypothetical protein
MCGQLKPQALTLSFPMCKHCEEPIMFGFISSCKGDNIAVKLAITSKSAPDFQSFIHAGDSV